jgi:hypothetical protein
MYLMERIGFGPSIKSRVRDWLDSSSYSIQTVQDANEFHFVMVDPVGSRTDIFQVKADFPVMIVSRNHLATPEQLSTYQSLSNTDQQRFWNNIRLELLRYGVEFSDLTLEKPGTSFSDAVVVSRTTTAVEFLKRVLFVRSGARLYWGLLLELNPPPSTAVANGSTPPMCSNSHPPLSGVTPTE